MAHLFKRRTSGKELGKRALGAPASGDRRAGREGASASGRVEDYHDAEEVCHTRLRRGPCAAHWLAARANARRRGAVELRSAHLPSCLACAA